MSHERKLKALNDWRIVYKRTPIDDKPTITHIHERTKREAFDYYEKGTYECYELFRSKAKINTYKSLKWHLLVLWYLNPQLDQDRFAHLAYYIATKNNGFITFEISDDYLTKMIYEVSMMDLDTPPKNRLRKIIFRHDCGLTTEEKLREVGRMIGRTKKCTQGDIYDAMLDINDSGKVIIIRDLAKLLGVTSRTIHRNMEGELKREKELLNRELDNG